MTVLAAASLTDAVDDLARAFEDGHGGVRVAVATGPSSALREQVLEGAPADVVALADVTTARQLAGSGRLRSWEVFARNRLQLAVPLGNPGGVTGVADLGDDDLLVGLCAAAVPCGRYARDALAAAGIVPSLDTEAGDARGLLTLVASGDLDVGIVYRTDVLAAGGAVEGIDLPAHADVVVELPVAVLDDARSPAAHAFATFLVESEVARSVLADHGFEPPAAPTA